MHLTPGAGGAVPVVYVASPSKVTIEADMHRDTAVMLMGSSTPHLLTFRLGNGPEYCGTGCQVAYGFVISK